MGKSRIIYCPQCGRELGTYDGRSSINKTIDCRKCKKRIVYRVDSEKIEVKPIPPRVTSSGMTFY